MSWRSPLHRLPPSPASTQNMLNIRLLCGRSRIEAAVGRQPLGLVPLLRSARGAASFGFAVVLGTMQHFTHLEEVTNRDEDAEEPQEEGCGFYAD